jgi:hypothetical protein
MADPDDWRTIEETAILTGRKIEVVCASAQDILATIVAFYGDETN